VLWIEFVKPHGIQSTPGREEREKRESMEKKVETLTEDSLRDALFSEPPAAHTILAFDDGKPTGYVTYYCSFASSVGRRGLWLDDVYVVPDYRGQGVGKALMTYLADLAVRNKCERFEWMALVWNRSAIGLYEDLGATVLPAWRVCRIDGENLLSTAGQITTVSDNS
jgi:GNAT superfamily N-acetyltransferase